MVMGFCSNINLPIVLEYVKWRLRIVIFNDRRFVTCELWVCGSIYILLWVCGSIYLFFFHSVSISYQLNAAFVPNYRPLLE